MGSLKAGSRRGVLTFAMSGIGALAMLTLLPIVGSSTTGATQVKSTSHGSNISALYSGAPKQGELDCNGDSPSQAPARLYNCTDIRGFSGVNNQNTWGGKFYDNGKYIGHDEPDTTFLSTQPGSGGNVNWNLTLGKDPTALPTATTPGSDVSHWFELSPAPWLSMAICDPNSYPQNPCTPNSDANAASGSFTGGGSAFLEMQFYPPGNPPFVDSASCDDTHWCAAMTIDSLECTYQFATCNNNCVEPVNVAFIQTNGVPAAAPNPQSYPDNQFNNADTLLMNPGDSLKVHIWDAPVPGQTGQRALEITINDSTTGQSGFMQASAANGFQNTSMADCSGTPYNFEPEYSTASAGNYIPWAALQTNISTEFETGHFEPCTSLSQSIANPIDANDTSVMFNKCSGPYERAGGTETSEAGDGICWQKGDTHAGYAGTGTSTAPDEINGCEDNLFQNGDLDFDGTPYYAEWPTGTTPTSLFPSSFVESLPTTSGKSYPKLFFQTDVALSESACTATNPSGCTVPAPGPGNFYPYWSEATGSSGKCSLEFGNVSTGVDDFSQDAQYGTVQLATLGYPEFEGNILKNTCPAS
jgi:hypothetical protein